MCVSGKVVLWPKHFDIRIRVPMFYSKLGNHIIYTFMYIYIIYIYSRMGKNNNNYDRVPGVAGGRERVAPAISVDTIRGARKKDLQH